MMYHTLGSVAAIADKVYFLIYPMMGLCHFFEKVDFSDFQTVTTFFPYWQKWSGWARWTRMD
jgi:hypothetical protein